MIQIEGFNVRIVNKGDSYGKDNCLVHDGDEALVEFYDGRSQPASRLGQFVSRYYYTTLLADYPYGLLLDSQWRSISPKGMKELKRYINGYLQEVA